MFSQVVITQTNKAGINVEIYQSIMTVDSVKR